MQHNHNWANWNMSKCQINIILGPMFFSLWDSNLCGFIAKKHTQKKHNPHPLTNEFSVLQQGGAAAPGAAETQWVSQCLKSNNSTMPLFAIVLSKLYWFLLLKVPPEVWTTAAGGSAERSKQRSRPLWLPTRLQSLKFFFYVFTLIGNNLFFFLPRFKKKRTSHNVQSCNKRDIRTQMCLFLEKLSSSPKWQANFLSFF